MTWSERMLERLRTFELSHDQIVTVMELLMEVREAADFAGYRRGMNYVAEQEEITSAVSKCKPFVCLCPVCRSWA
jgi:hypothetical protein